MIKAITFDFWETIICAIDYSDVRINFLTRILEIEGFSKNRKLIKDAYLSAQKAFYNTWKNEQKYIAALERTESILKTLEINLSNKSKHNIIKHFEEITLLAPPPLMNDSEMVLKSLYNNYRIGLICDSGLSPGKILRKILKYHNVLKYFCCTIFSDEIGRNKPNPIVFKQALNKLEVKPPEAMHIGDLLETDIAGAKAVGMKTVWFNWKNESKKSKTNIVPDYEIDKLSQLLQILPL
ncbi:HAD family hydrolase [candidate division WOR-3 bacterium]|nr:HAD family hydrolase [candidate division WOR-3 bacterium]